MLDIRDIGMMFLWQENKPKSFEKIDSAQRRDPQVEEDPEDDGRRNEPQKWGQQYRKADEKADAESCDALVWNIFNTIAPWENMSENRFGLFCLTLAKRIQ